MPSTLESSVPAEFTADQHTALPLKTPEGQGPGVDFKAIGSYVQSWWRNIHENRTARRAVWDECWAQFRGVEDFSNKAKWQSKIVLPKANATVKQATSVIMRLWSQSGQPWRYEPIDKQNITQQIRAEKKTQLVQAFLDAAKWLQPIRESLEGGFIMGLAVVKASWGYESKLNLQVNPDGSIVQDEVAQGRLFIRSVDPYNFYWLPGSRLNTWTGTIEQIELPIWEVESLINSLKEAGLESLLNPEALSLQPSKIQQYDKMSGLRANDIASNTKSPNKATDTIKVTEYYGPLFDGESLITKNGHVLMLGDKVLIAKKNTMWNGRPPYIAWSPLIVPHRTEGQGLIENVRDILKQYSKITNQAVDNVAYSMLPVFEVFEDAYENPEDFETGIVPGKVLRRKTMSMAMSLPGIKPMEFQDISAGAVQVAAQLDRSYQEGAMVGEIQQAIPRYRGVQSAAEVEIKDQNQQSFFGAMTSDMEENFIAPLVDYCGDLIMQFLDTTSDPRISQILGYDYTTFAGMTHAQKLAEVHGDFSMKVSGISEQFEKAEMLNNLVQFMNLIGQNPEAWLPFIDQTELLKRIVEGFRPTIHDIDKIVVTPEVAAYQQQQQLLMSLTPDVLAMLPNIIQMAQNAEQAKRDAEVAREQATQKSSNAR